MKIIIIQENGRHEENKNFRECFCFQRAFQKLGHECEVWGLGHWGYGTPPDFNSYDLVIMAENYDETGWVPNLSLCSKPVKFLWSIDPHVRGMAAYRKTFEENKFDLILQAVPDHVDSDSIFFPNAFDDSIIGPRPDVEKISRLGFCGNILPPRAPYIEYLHQHHDLKKDLFVIGESMVRAINSYYIHFNMNIANDINYRCFETIGCGTVLLTNYHPKMEELGFVSGKNCLMYNNPIEIEEMLKTENLSEIAAAGLELSKRHTYAKRAEHLLDIYGTI